MVDQAIRLNPNFPMWSARPFAYAYFMAGRYEESLKMIRRLALENYNAFTWVLQSGALAALGRNDEARASVQDALKMFPNLTIEEHISDPSWNDVERKRFVETMKLAGFPTCAKPEIREKIEKGRRLAECGA